MIQPPTNLQLDNIVQTSSGSIYVNRIIISFTSPSDVDYTGIKIYYSYDNVTYTYLETYLARNLTESEGRTTITHNLTSVFDGRDVWLKLSAFTTYNQESSQSSAITFETIATPPTVSNIYFDTKKVSIEIVSLSTAGGRNDSFTGFQISKYSSVGTLYEIIGGDSTEVIFSSDNFTLGDRIRVEYIARKVVWEGDVSVAGYFTISDSNLLIDDYLFEYNDVSMGDFNIFRKNALISTVLTSSTIYTDSLVTTGEFYFYDILSKTSARESLNVLRGVNITDLSTEAPTLRLFEQNNTSLLKENWREMKDSLWDSNYYDKENFTLPYINGTEYQAKIYVGGIYNVTVDAWLNSEYLGPFTTDKSGEVEVGVTLRQGSNEFKVRLRNEDGTVVNSQTYTYDLKAHLNYIFFMVFGMLLGDLETQIANSKKHIFVDTSDYLDKWGDLTGIFRVFGWTKAQYREVIKDLITAYKYNAVVEGLEGVLNAFHAIETFWIWEYLEPEGTIRVPYMVTSTGLISREDFTYGVVACKYNGEETTPTTLRVDNRWRSQYYYTPVAFEWDEVSGADFYKIYRSSTGSTTPLGFLTSTGSTKWIDHAGFNFYTDSGDYYTDEGGYTDEDISRPNFNIVPLSLNFSSMSAPANLERVILKKVREREFYYYSGGHLKIVVGGSRDFLENERELIYSTIRRIIPSELRLKMIFGDDSGSYRLESKYPRNYGYENVL